VKGIVVCPQPRAADVGADVLADGGNAFDAAIATAFVQMVTDPFMCGLGGMGTLTYLTADGEAGVIDFHTRAGSKVTADMWRDDFRGVTEFTGYTLFDDQRGELGYTSIMTPGAVAGFWETHQRFGTLPWVRLLQPAADMAREGVAMTSAMRFFLVRENQPGLPSGMERVSTTEACRTLFVRPDGIFYEVGEILRYPEMADTIEAIGRDGAHTFYRGDIAKVMADDLEANGSYVTREDLADYRVRVGSPIEGRYRGYQVLSAQPPASGTVLVQLLNILEQFDLASLGHNTAEYLDIVARTMSAAHIDRAQHISDPEFWPVPTEMMISQQRAGELAALIKAGEFPKVAKQKPDVGTTHLVTYDETGNAVTSTHTLGSASGVVTPGLGFQYNNSMKLGDPIPGRPLSFAPGKARITGMVPTILTRDGRPAVITGAPGGSVVISATLQAILNVVDFGMSPLEAVTVPRMHCEGQAVHIEFNVQGSVREGLSSMGHDVIQVPVSPLNYGRPYMITVDESGTWRGGSDPRGDAGMAQIL
jgi:gamma-glutamyltranspeptidase / glutathione hydrolase